MREWEWSPELRDYRPVGEYLCGWREAVRAHWERTGELFERKRFDASVQPSMLALIPSPPMPDAVPHVRAKEDVPHEHALPDLYGLRSA
jgi:hypothetical protein